MEPTHLSFIQQLSDHSEEAWQELESVYRPMILNWLRRYPLQAVDAEDLAQEVMATVVERIGDFEHNGRIGAFRNWLRTTAVNQARTYLRKNNIRPTAKGSDTFEPRVHQPAARMPTCRANPQWQSRCDGSWVIRHGRLVE